MRKLVYFLAVFVSIAIAAAGGNALAAVSAQEAAKLGTTLTAVGAEKAGNADGSIPPYTGGNTRIPAGFNPKKGIRPNPYANEKPLFSINASNMDQYAARLTEGSKAMLKKYPGYRMDIYPTHRSAAFPKHVLDNTAKNAVRAKTAKDGVSIRDAHGGVPFPIPKTGHEVMWNHLATFKGVAYKVKNQAWVVDKNGRPTMTGDGRFTLQYPYYDESLKSADEYFLFAMEYVGPPRRAGEGILIRDPLNMAEKSRKAWQYLPGQRRVKLAPELDFDTPNTGHGGMTTFDDGFLFSGSLERYDWKIVGKKEIYVPYNCYDMLYNSSVADMKQNYLNPDKFRWELHRTWVVEASLKPGKRHIYPKRRYYIDEDSWAALAVENYDARGNIYRVGYTFMTPSYDAPAPFTDSGVLYDLVTNVYALMLFLGNGGTMEYTKPLPMTMWGPDMISGKGVR